MSETILKTIQTEFVPHFKEQIPHFFKENLIFAFICGGFAKGYADKNHDIDMFICVNSLENHQIDHFRDWYFKIHKHYNLPYDEDCPGEIMTFHKLRASLDLIKELTITTFAIQEYELYESIVWGDMLSDKIIGKTGNLSLLNKLLAECSGYPQKWKKQILNMLSREEKDYWKDIAPQLLMEKYMTYPKTK